MSLKISRILHAGYIFTYGQTNIVFDPIFENPFSQNCYAFPNIKFDYDKIKKLRFDAVFISHYHDDHFSLKSLNLIHRDTPIYIYCIFEEIINLIQQLGFKKVYQIGVNEKVTISSFAITSRKALDAAVDSLFQIEIENLNILNVVDSWIDDDTLKKLEDLKPWNLILWPFQKMQELEVLAPDRFPLQASELPDEWIAQIKILQPQSIIPSSCQFKMEEGSWYNNAFFPISYEKFQHDILKILPQTKIIKLNPGQSINWNGSDFVNSKASDWIDPIGDQNLDYQYKPHAIIPDTKSIAKNFPDLQPDQKLKVLNFCRIEILNLFNTLEKSEDSYFNSDLTWCLILWDNLGEKTEFIYQIQNHQISLISKASQYDWTTEIPIFKLYSALENAESLTSIYVRINGSQFEDMIDDPLLKCLYNGKVASYQKSQLKDLTINL